MRGRIIRERFRLPWRGADAISAVTGAYMAEVELRHRKFIADAATTEHIRLAAEWLTKGNPKFGLLLCGACGNGKTTMASAIRSLVAISNRYETLYVYPYDARQVCEAARSSYKEFSTICSREMISLDDLGVEPAEVLDYGNVLNPVIELLSRRYNEQLFTIVTTNLTPPQIRQHYGDRVADRFNEMFDRIIFENSSYRG